MKHCEECNEILPMDEKRFFEDTCDACEAKWGERINLWLRGGNDALLDSMV